MAAAPGAWDWAAAHVPSPLTDELEAAQALKKVRVSSRTRTRGGGGGGGGGREEA